MSVYCILLTPGSLFFCLNICLVFVALNPLIFLSVCRDSLFALSLSCFISPTSVHVYNLPVLLFVVVAINVGFMLQFVKAKSLLFTDCFCCFPSVTVFMSTSYLSPRFLWVVCVFRLQQLSLVVLFFCCFARMCSVPPSLSTVDFHVLSLSWAPLVKDFNHVRLTSESRSYLYTCFYSFELIPLSCKFFMTLHVPSLVSFLLCLCLWLCFSVILHVSRQ